MGEDHSNQDDPINLIDEVMLNCVSNGAVKCHIDNGFCRRNFHEIKIK